MADTIIDGTGEELPGRRILSGTDLEIAYNLLGDDLVLRVNKGGTAIGIQNRARGPRGQGRDARRGGRQRGFCAWADGWQVGQDGA